MENNFASTDEYGRVTFSGFKLISGPVGRYGMKFTSADPNPKK
jgi:hypothetical protein